MRKAMVGIVPLVDDERDSYWMLPGYMKGIEGAGGIPLMLPLTSDEIVIGQLANAFDGFLFTGGQDVSPGIYGEEALPECGGCCEARDEMERALLSAVLKLDKPVLGICRGIQFINAALGGTLYQDLPVQHPSDTEHHQSPPYDIPIHRVQVYKGSPLHRHLNIEQLMVNSYHHQAIRTLSPELEAMAVSEDGLTEAICMPGQRFLWAVQWHPEFSFDKDKSSERIFRAFLKACEAD